MASKTYLYIIIASFLVFGVFDGAYPANIKISIWVHSVLLAVFLFEWCKRHAYENSIDKIGLKRLIVASFPIVGVPTYFFMHFGFRSGGIKTFKAIIFTMLLMTIYFTFFELIPIS